VRSLFNYMTHGAEDYERVMLDRMQDGKTGGVYGISESYHC
jgi:hypothetical protein